MKTMPGASGSSRRAGSPDGRPMWHPKARLEARQLESLPGNSTNSFGQFLCQPKLRIPLAGPSDDVAVPWRGVVQFKSQDTRVVDILGVEICPAVQVSTRTPSMQFRVVPNLLVAQTVNAKNRQLQASFCSEGQESLWAYVSRPPRYPSFREDQTSERKLTAGPPTKPDGERSRQVAQGEHLRRSRFPSPLLR